jgi:NitT/TauT family transport system substrate-binding protein
MKVLYHGRAARIAVVLAAVAALGVSAATATAAPQARAATKDNTIVLGYPGIPPIFMAVRAYVADRMGYYKKYGVNVVLKGFTTGTDAVRAVQAGQIDAAWSPTPFALTLISKGTPLVAIEGMDKVDWVIGSNSSSVKTCADLKGQNIGVDSIGGARYQALQAMLTKCNLTIQDVHPVVFPGNTAIQALLAGQLHVSVLHLDDLAQASAKGGTPVRTIISIAQTDPFQSYDLLVTTRSDLAAKRSLFVDLLKADIQATRYMYKPSALNKVADIATVTGEDIDVTKSALRQYLALHWWPLNKSGLGIASITRTIYENVKLGNISAGNPPTWKDVVDTSLWNQAYKAVTPKVVKKHAVKHTTKKKKK